MERATAAQLARRNIKNAKPRRPTPIQPIAAQQPQQSMTFGGGSSLFGNRQSASTGFNFAAPSAPSISFPAPQNTGFGSPSPEHSGNESNSAGHRLDPTGEEDKRRNRPPPHSSEFGGTSNGIFGNANPQSTSNIFASSSSSFNFGSNSNNAPQTSNPFTSKVSQATLAPASSGGFNFSFGGEPKKDAPTTTDSNTSNSTMPFSFKDVSNGVPRASSGWAENGQPIKTPFNFGAASTSTQPTTSCLSNTDSASTAGGPGGSFGTPKPATGGVFAHLNGGQAALASSIFSSGTPAQVGLTSSASASGGLFATAPVSSVALGQNTSAPSNPFSQPPSTNTPAASSIFSHPPAPSSTTATGGFFSHLTSGIPPTTSTIFSPSVAATSGGFNFNAGAIQNGGLFNQAKATPSTLCSGSTPKTQNGGDLASQITFQSDSQTPPTEDNKETGGGDLASRIAFPNTTPATSAPDTNTNGHAGGLFVRVESAASNGDSSTPAASNGGLFGATTNSSTTAQSFFGNSAPLFGPNATPKLAATPSLFQKNTSSSTSFNKPAETSAILSGQVIESISSPLNASTHPVEPSPATGFGSNSNTTKELLPTSSQSIPASTTNTTHGTSTAIKSDLSMTASHMIPDEKIAPFTPSRYTSFQRAHFYNAYRLRSLNTAMKEFYAAIPAQYDTTRSVEWSNQMRAEINARLKRTLDSLGIDQEKENPSKGHMSSNPSQPESDPAPASAESNKFIPSTNGSNSMGAPFGTMKQSNMFGNGSFKTPNTAPPKQLNHFGNTNGASQSLATALKQPQSFGDGGTASSQNITHAAPQISPAKSKRKAEEQLTKDYYEAGERELSKARTPVTTSSGKSATSSMFQRILDSPDNATTEKREIKSFPTPAKESTEAPARANPFAKMSPIGQSSVAPASPFQPSTPSAMPKLGRFTPPAGSTPQAPTFGGVKPSVPNLLEVPKFGAGLQPPKFGAAQGGGIDFSAQFKAKAEVAEKKALQDALDQDFDSDNSDGETKEMFIEKYKLKRKAAKDEIDGIAKTKKVKSVGGTFSFDNTPADSSAGSSPSVTRAASPAYQAKDPGYEPHRFLNLEAGKTVASRSEASGVNSKEETENDDGDESSEDADDEEENQENEEPVSKGKSLFERVTYPEGHPMAPGGSEEKENTKPAEPTRPASIFDFSKSSTSFSQSFGSASGDNIDKTWSPDKGLKFATSSTAAPAITFSDATPKKVEVGDSVFATLKQASGSNIFGSPSTPPAGEPAKFVPGSGLFDSKPIPGEGLFGSKPAPASGLFGQNIGPTNVFTGFSTPSGSTTPSTGFNFGTTNPATSLLKATALPSNATSRATTPGELTDVSQTGETGNDDDEGAKEAQADFLRGAGEEDEDVVYEIRARAALMENKHWAVKGTGPFRILKHKETGFTRILLRKDPTGGIVMNYGLIAADYNAKGSSVGMVLPEGDGEMSLWSLTVKKGESVKLAAALNQHQN